MIFTALMRRQISTRLRPSPQLMTLAYSRLLSCFERIQSVSDKSRHSCKSEWGHSMAKKVAGRRALFDGSRLKKINWRRLGDALQKTLAAYVDAQLAGKSDAILNRLGEAYRKSRNELDGAILQDQQARVNQ